MKPRPLIPAPALIAALCSDSAPTDETITAQLSDTELLEVIVEVVNLEEELGLQAPGADLFEHPELLVNADDEDEDEDEALRTAYIILLYLG